MCEQCPSQFILLAYLQRHVDIIHKKSQAESLACAQDIFQA